MRPMALPRGGRGAYRGRLDDTEYRSFAMNHDDPPPASIRTPMRRAAIGLAILAAACALPLGADASPRGLGHAPVAVHGDAATARAPDPSASLRNQRLRVTR